MRQSHIPAPPVVSQGHGSCTEVAALQVLRGVATPAPLVLQLIKAVLAIGTVAVELADGLDLKAGVGHQDGVVPALERIGVLEVEVLLTLGLFSRQALHCSRLGL